MKKEPRVRKSNAKAIKLTVEEVAEIKYLLEHSTYSERSLAIQYNVKRGCIKSIRYGQSWKDVPTPSEFP